MVKKPKKSSKNTARKIIEALRDKAPLNNNRGPVIGGHAVTGIKKSKAKKDKGRVEARLVNHEMKWKKVHEELIEPEKFWNEWNTPRDGWMHGTMPDQLYHKWRGCYCQDKERIYEQNHKLIKQIKIREARKIKSKTFI